MLGNYGDVEERIARNSVRYRRERSLDGTVEYAGGSLVTVREMELPVGLLGYTDTNSTIVLTTRDDFGVPKQEVFLHEKEHCRSPWKSEQDIRYETAVEFEASSDLSAFSIYQKPLYDSEL
jgi:hypothetical protein